MAVDRRRSGVSRWVLHVFCGWVSLLLVFPLAGKSESPTRAASPTANACVKTALETIQNFYDSLTDLEGRFRQTTESVGIGAAIPGESSQSKGRVILAKPGRMRWQYESPEPSLVISDGKDLWIYEETAREAQHLAVTTDYLSGAALQFLMGGGRLQDEYEVQGGACTDDEVEVRLLPRRPSTYERLDLRAKSDTGEIVETVLIDLLGNRTRLSLYDVRTNRNPAASVFVFDVPPGVRVIDLVPSQ